MRLSSRIVLFVLVVPIGVSNAFVFDICQIGILAWILNLISFGTWCPKVAPPPTSSPTPALNGVEDFKGILNAFSLNKGIIEIDWEERFLDFDGITFDVFIALGEYDYKAALEDATVFELIGVFSSETTFQHLEVADASNIKVDTPYFGQAHTLLVTAQLEGQYSQNSQSTRVVVSSSDPHMRDGVNIVGVFFPTSRLTIDIEDVAEGIEHTLSFIGPVSSEARNLKVGDYMTGFTSELDPFVRGIIEIVENTPSRVVLNVVSVRLEEIFDALDLDSSFAVSRADPGIGRRRLGFFDWLNDNIVKPFNDNVIKPIGDAVTGVVENVVDLFDDGQFEDTIKASIVNVDEEWTLQVDELSITGHANIEVGISATVRVAILVPVYAKIEAKAEYDIGSTLSISEGVGQEYDKSYDIWQGSRWSRLIFVGPVPVELYAQPSLDFTVSASATLSATIEAGFSARGGTSVGVRYDAGANPVVKEEVVPPFNDFDRTLPTLSGTAEFAADAGITLAIEAGMYGGLVSATMGLRGGVDLTVAAGVTVVGDTVLPTVNNFELNLGFNIPVQAKFLYGAFVLDPGSPVWEKKWPIITLPSVSLDLLDDHRCLTGANGAQASFSLKAESSYPDDAIIDNPVEGSDWYIFSVDGWTTGETSMIEAEFEKAGLVSVSPEPDGTVTVALQPRIPPLLKVVTTISLDSLFTEESVPCTGPASCDGEPFFNKLTQTVGSVFNAEIFLSQPPDPSAPLVPSTVYKFEDFMAALRKLQGAGSTFQFWLGDDCSIESQKAAFVNMAAFLGQSMRETIIYDACDENNWDLWRADIFKEPTSPPENSAALYPMSSGCGQLGQKYAEYRCDDECPQDLTMEQTAATNAAWIGAPPPLFCGPRSKYDGLGYWNPQQFCGGPDRTCVGEPFYYEGQTAGVHVPVSEDGRFPQYFYTHPLPDANGNTPNVRTPEAFPATNVEGCCWWGRGVIQTTGRCNFGKLNKQIGAGAGSNALYPDINFCQDPESICTGPSDLKWIAGIFYWVTEPQSYNRNGYNFLDGIKDFVARGCAEVDTDPNRDDCSVLFEYASGIVNRGCHNPGDGGCPGCIPGATCDPAHNVPERVAASKQALQALLQYMA